MAESNNKLLFKKILFKSGVIVQVYNPSGRGRQISELEVRLVYRVSEKKKKQKEKEGKKEGKEGRKQGRKGKEIACRLRLEAADGRP